MSTVCRLRAALAAVPVQHPCTAEAVQALHAEGSAPARTLVDVNRQDADESRVLDTSIQQAVPGACMPVLTWLAAGLRSGMSLSATQQAHEMACLLLGVVSRVLFHDVQVALAHQEVPDPHLKRVATGYLRQLGSTEAMCRQLAQVTAALVATFPGIPASTSATSSTSATTSTSTATGPASSSGPGNRPSLQHHALLSVLWHDVSRLLFTACQLDGQVPVLTLVASSGLLHALLEGMLLVLGTDQAAYLQGGQEEQDMYLDMLWHSHKASMLLLRLGGRSFDICEALLPDALYRVIGPQPWMQPLLNLYIIQLAKMQWDARRNPDLMAHAPYAPTWPADALARALTQLRSPSVAGALLRKRAPELAVHVHTYKAVEAPKSQLAQTWLWSLGPGELGRHLRTVASLMRRLPRGFVFATDAQDLGLLLEVTELYCLVCPGGGTDDLLDSAWGALRAGMVCREDVSHPFLAARGEALLGITEYLTEDVLLVLESGSAPNLNNNAALQRDASTSTSPGDVSSGSGSSTGATPASSPSGSTRQPTAGDSMVPLETRLTWVQHVMDVMGILSARVQLGERALKAETGRGAKSLPKFITSSTAPRLSRLLEVHLRNPSLLKEITGHLLHLLPLNVAPLHAAASSRDGSAALLSAITTAAKRQQVLHAALTALVRAGGAVEPAAAAFMAAVPGPMGRVVAEQLVKQPAELVKHAIDFGRALGGVAGFLLVRAAALLDPVLAPGAAYLARGLPPGEDSQLAGLEALLSILGEEATLYRSMLMGSPVHVARVTKALQAALASQQAVPAAKQAARLAKKAGAGAAQEEQLCQQLQGMWLRGSGTGAAGSSSDGMATQATTSNDGSTTAASRPDVLPEILQALCDKGLLTQQQVLAAGDPAQWTAAVRPPTPADLHVAGTALLTACRAAGAVAQLPQVLQQALRVTGAGSQPESLPHLRRHCNTVADLALMLAPLLGLILPAKQAAQLQEAAAGIGRGAGGWPQTLPPATVTRVLGVLGAVVPPGAPGCSYPGCCNLEGRSEAELPVLVCSSCQGVRYCCREHQAAHWKAGHKEVCKAAQAAAQRVMDVATGGSDQVPSSG